MPVTGKRARAVAGVRAVRTPLQIAQLDISGGKFPLQRRITVRFLRKAVEILEALYRYATWTSLLSLTYFLRTPPEIYRAIDEKRASLAVDPNHENTL